MMCVCVLSYCSVSVCASDIACVRNELQCDVTVFCNGLSNIALTRDALVVCCCVTTFRYGRVACVALACAGIGGT
jgi:hypothetical protein